MNKFFILFLSVLCFSACNQVEKMDKQLYEPGEDTTAVTSLNQLNEIDEQEKETERNRISKLLMKASGSEPGWFAEFYNNRLRLVLDYGKDSLLLVDTSFEKVGDPTGFTYLNASISNGKNTSVKIKIDIAECVGASGEKQSRKISVTYKKKTYSGCAELVE
jgi:hypothetical protein